ncbi:MAG TPA: hypothetical protein VFF68_08115 [Anaerolineaceae bacterium]|nr:hypothetical protein [Anaerolineaceae bacterium]
MKKILRWLILAALATSTLTCLVFLFDNVNYGIVLPRPTPTATPETLDPRGQAEHIARSLRNAPWQGLRFLSAEKEWRFYGWTGETRQIKIIVPFDLIKVYYLQEGGDLTFTWVATGADIPGHGYYQVATSPVEPGQLVAIRLQGEHVGLWGVDWEDCDSEYCHLAAMIDTILVLDDKGTGLSNGFIKFGWEPPTYPMYGFLCWSIEPVVSNSQLVAMGKP